MRKNINKLATLVMTGALAASMSFGAFADPVQTDVQPTQGETTTTTTTTSTSTRPVGTSEKMTVHKKVKVAEGSNLSAPNGSFIFDVTTVGSDDTETSRQFEVKDGNTTANKTYDIKKGTADQIVNAEVKATFAPTTDAAGFDKTFDVEFDESKFTEAGIYKFKLTEKNVSDYKDKDGNSVRAAYPGVVYDTTSKAMYVFVARKENSTDLEVKNVVIMNANGTAKIDEIENKYGQDDPNTPVDEGAYKLTIAKEIAGNMAVATDTFTFNIKVDADADGEHFVIEEKDGNSWKPVYVKDDKGNDTTTKLELVDGQSQGLKVKGGTQYRINGLTAGDVVSVKEDGATNLGYNNIAYKAESENNKIVDLTDAGNDGITEADTFKVSLTKEDGTLTITNTRDQLTPTGVVMDVAPYALMVALASGAAATFLRKKESFED